MDELISNFIFQLIKAENWFFFDNIRIFIVKNISKYGNNYIYIISAMKISVISNDDNVVYWGEIYIIILNYWKLFIL